MGGFYYTRKYEIRHQALEADEATSTPRPSSPPSSVHETPSDCTTPSNSGFLPDGTFGRETLDITGTLVTLEALESEPNLVKSLAAISRETIEDKSKGDALSKTISVLQISWFIVQCVARAIQHLPITLLEMTALAFAGLSIITYLLWWHKPLNVKYHISLGEVDLTPTQETYNLEEFASHVMPFSHKAYAYWIPLTIGGTHAYGCYDSIVDGAFRVHSGTARDANIRLMTTGGVGFLFGAFHCLAWSFYFPSHTEMVLWRFSSTAILIGIFVVSHHGLIVLMVLLVSRKWCLKLRSTYYRPMREKKFWLLILTHISNMMMFFSVVAYIVARIMLIILASLQLRSLPLFAFCTIQWTTYIPHI